MKIKNAFTLAEVLITLVIIGVIAAMTIPTLMNNTNAQEYRTGIKKAMSMLNQAITMQYALDGTQVSDYATSATELRDELFVKRLSVIKTQDATAFGASGENTASDIFYTADGMKFGIATRNVAAGACDTDGNEPCFDIVIDVNGDKNPNTLTTEATRPKDVYYGKIYSQRVVPYDTATQGVMFDSAT